MGVAYYLQAWCVEMKGPVFLAAWTPLCFIFTIFCSSFFLGEIVHLGRYIYLNSIIIGLIDVTLTTMDENKHLSHHHLHDDLWWTYKLNACNNNDEPSFSCYLSFYGSIVGGIFLAGGLYSLLWGKSKEADIDPCSEMNKISDPQDHACRDRYICEDEEQARG
jgi:hypothetical protein